MEVLFALFCVMPSFPVFGGNGLLCNGLLYKGLLWFR